MDTREGQPAQAKSTTTTTAQQAGADESRPIGQPTSMMPGDQVPPGTPGAGPNICPTCGGTGRTRGRERCPTCNGSGTVIEAVGGGG